MSGLGLARASRLCLTAAPLVLALFAGGCAENGATIDTAALKEPVQGSAAPSEGSVATAEPSAPKVAAAEPARDLAVKPKVAKAIKEARALRADGKKSEALALLDGAEEHDEDRALLGERGLLALETGQIVKAETLLSKAQDPKAPDWRLQSAYGSALSANGRQSEAQSQFASALAQAPDHPSILNNLALSYALDGKHDEAEKMLRRAADKGGETQTRQNLALILGLKGRVAEAKTVADAVLPPEKVNENMAYFERIKNGATQISRVDPTAVAAAHAISMAASDKPIMQLGQPSN